MACDSSSLYMGWMTVAAASTTPVFIPATEWGDALGVALAKGWGEARGRNGNVTATPAVQFANDPRNASGAGTAVGATLSADGVSDPNGNTTVSSGSNKYVRGGWNVALSSGTTLATMTVSGVIQIIRGA